MECSSFVWDLICYLPENIDEKVLLKELGMDWNKWLNEEFYKSLYHLRIIESLSKDELW